LKDQIYNVNLLNLPVTTGMLSLTLESSSKNINLSKYNSTTQYKSNALSILGSQIKEVEEPFRGFKSPLNSHNASFNSSIMKIALSNLRTAGRNPNIMKCESEKVNKVRIKASQYIYLMKKRASYVTETVLANRNAGKGRGALRNGLARCENCTQLLAKGFPTVTCLCHKKKSIT